jgi:hypothetical protein
VSRRAGEETAGSARPTKGLAPAIIALFGLHFTASQQVGCRPRFIGREEKKAASRLAVLLVVYGGSSVSA